ncbi:MAG: matrixin family metalloprotease [Deltaproteobacteria bacterium]|nr:matrixin family metalloprotease [Deltaproteobacteria bacterium]
MKLHAIALILGLLANLPAAAVAAQPTIYIQPLGENLPARAAGDVRQAISAFYRVEVRLLEAIKLPAAAYYPRRRRFRAEKLLVALRQRLPADGTLILGLTAADISTTKGAIADWGVLGLATLDGVASVISLYRCKRGARDQRHSYQRLAKVAVHEVGHNFGLAHCPSHGCLMEDAKGKVSTSDREYRFCARCQHHLRQRAALHQRVTPPWPKPAKPL